MVPESPKGSYSSLMIKECKKLGMKPVCDHPSYCRNDAKALWIAQSGHLAYPGHRNNNKYVPSGFNKIRENWRGLCSYTGKAKSDNALCNLPEQSHSWRTPAQLNPGFVCGDQDTRCAPIGQGTEPCHQLCSMMDGHKLVACHTVCSWQA